MIRANDVLAIIHSNAYDEVIPELTNMRTMGSVPFGGRYRLIDFTLSNLVNAGILPLTFANAEDYDLISLGDKLVISDVRSCIKEGKDIVMTANGKEIKLVSSLSGRDIDIILAGGLLEYTKQN